MATFDGFPPDVPIHACGKRLSGVLSTSECCRPMGHEGNCEPRCPLRNTMPNARRCLRRTLHDGDCFFDPREEPDPVEKRRRPSDEAVVWSGGRDELAKREPEEFADDLHALELIVQALAGLPENSRERVWDAADRLMFPGRYR